MFNQILCGNHLDVLKRYPDDCFDMFLTSPPYDNLRDYEGYDFQFEPLAHELYRTLKPGGVGVWVVNDASKDGSESLASAKQKIFFGDECGFNIWDTMIYEKNGFAYPSQDRYYQVFEYMFILAKGKPFSIHLLKDRKNRFSGKNAKWSLKHSDRQKDGTLKDRKRKVVTPEYGIRFNIWKYSTGYGYHDTDGFSRDHPATFPEKLAEDHILSWSNPGDVVLDPMCGSGTTCKMAVKHQRQYVGIDIAEEYCDLARKRLDRFTTQTTIFEAMDNKRNGADFEPAAEFSLN